MHHFAPAFTTVARTVMQRSELMMRVDGNSDFFLIIVVIVVVVIVVVVVVFRSQLASFLPLANCITSCAKSNCGTFGIRVERALLSDFT